MLQTSVGQKAAVKCLISFMSNFTRVSTLFLVSLHERLLKIA